MVMMVASAQGVETSVNTNNSPSQDYTTKPGRSLKPQHSSGWKPKHRKRWERKGRSSERDHDCVKVRQKSNVSNESNEVMKLLSTKKLHDWPFTVDEEDQEQDKQTCCV